MAGDAPTLQSLVDETTPLIQAMSIAPLMCTSDAVGYFTLAKGWTANPLALKAPYQDQQQQLDALVDQMAPPPPADALPAAQVVQLFIQAAPGGTGGDLLSALAELDKLSWPSRFQVLEDLSGQAPTLDGQNYLELIEATVGTLPNTNAAVHAAMIVVLMNQGGRTLTSIDIAVNFTRALALLGTDDQWRLLAKLGINGRAIEGTMAQYAAQAVAAGLLIPPPALLAILSAKQDTTDIGKWELPGKQPQGLYIGQVVHTAIAKIYKEVNAPLGGIIRTNTTAVDAIVNAVLGTLTGKLMFEYEGIAAALALSRPDIFDYNVGHPLIELGDGTAVAPAWVYEIKPWNSLETAVAEANFYADALLLAGIPTTTGPPSMPGTSGCLPAPGGWYAYAALIPGAIVYYYQAATAQEIEARGLEPASYQPPQAVLQQVLAALTAAGATGQATSQAGPIAALLGALLAAGWAIPCLLAL